jgi:hypothetical protein
MNSDSILQNFSTGRLVLQSPCHVGRDTMDAQTDGNRFCHSCQKVVHNLVGKSEAEIKALFVASGGQLCGSFTQRRPVQGAEIKLAAIQPMRKPGYLKHLAATASLLLLYQGMMAVQTSAKPASEWVVPAFPHTVADGRNPDKDWSQNTLLSGVIVNQDGFEVGLDVMVEIYAHKVLIAKVIAQHGFIKIDLGGKVKPNEMVGLVIRKNTGYAAQDSGIQEIHGGLKKYVLLRDAQNLALTIHYEFMVVEENQIDGGMMWEEMPEPEPVLEPEIIPIAEPDQR